MNAIIQVLGETLGHLDNQVEKWIGREDQIRALLPHTREQLLNHFPENSVPIRIMAHAEHTYRQLLAALSPEEQTANGYLNLRFYIMLNGFLAACQESLEKVKHNHSLDPAVLVEKSYYTPYFFDRVTYTREEIIDLLDEDIARLETASLDQKGVMLALRIRKGTALTLTESYCPLHPRLYPLVAELEQVPISKDPAVITSIIEKLTTIQGAIS